jgi:hypothetical protein
MGCRTLGLAAVATLGLLIIAKPDPASATGALALATMGTKAPAALSTGPRVSVHFRKTQSYYCYPRNYWWFYRPYNTAYDGHARCMPYFHYLEPYGRGGKPDRSMK